MSWVRTDDGEVLDDRIGDLTDREYRARHALLQYLAREHNETGIFHESRANRAVFSTLKGARTVTPTILRRLIQLDLVERVESLSDEYLGTLEIERPEGPGWLRPSRWEKYNPPRDTTNAERQKRYRESLRNAESNTVTNAVADRDDNSPSRAGAPASPSRPVTVNDGEGTSSVSENGLPLNEPRPPGTANPESLSIREQIKTSLAEAAAATKGA